jgi:DNA-binding NarL/FixJ family response regulator
MHSGPRGLETTLLLQQKTPNAKILIMTQHDPIAFLPAALGAGAHACVEKSHLGRRLLAIIKNIMQSPEALQIAAAS